jgi:hypothetical protein
MTKTVPQRLSDLGHLFEERNKLYGSNYKNFGKVLTGMFPNGIVLQTEQEFNRFAIFVQIMHKTTRLAQSMPGAPHEDSCDDLSVYTQMLVEAEG